ncbi:MAG: hypothetical protein DMF53_14240 [Acidobacteria bacterium]|nr:MAG: hypothetical protein DMF53_14240 [Acidobacteriota bacterium]
MSRPDYTLHRPFFLTGIAVTLTAGATWGAILLLRIAQSRSFTEPSIFAVNAHGQAQIYGWVGLFVLGFAYQMFPRFQGIPLPWPRLAFLSLGLMTGGIVARSFGEAPRIAPLALAGGAAQLAAVLLFATVMVRTLRAPGWPRGAHEPYVLAAVAWFVIGTAFDLFHLARLLAAPDAKTVLAQVATFQLPLRDLQIHGLAMMMIFGVSLWYLPKLVGSAPPSERRARALWLPLQLALIGEVVLFITFMRTRQMPWVFAMWGADVLFALCAAALVLDLHLFRPVRFPDRSLKFLRAAQIWLLLSLAMRVAAPFWAALLGKGFSHAWYGATRHAVTVGFISLTIVGVSSRLMPMLAGLDPRKLTTLRAPFLLLNLGCAMRVLFQVATDLTPRAFPLAGISGVLEVTGLTIWGFHLAAVMLGRVRQPVAAREEGLAAV